MLETGMKHIPTEVCTLHILFGINIFLANKQLVWCSFISTDFRKCVYATGKNMTGREVAYY
jgi:hypothetical protein